MILKIMIENCSKHLRHTCLCQVKTSSQATRMHKDINHGQVVSVIGGISVNSVTHMPSLASLSLSSLPSHCHHIVINAITGSKHQDTVLQKSCDPNPSSRVPEGSANDTGKAMSPINWSMSRTTDT